MKIVSQRELTISQKRRIVALWNAEYPAELAYREVTEFDEYLDALNDKTHFLLINDDGEIAGWAMIFERGGARWFAVIVDGKFQGEGLGIRLIEGLKTVENRFFGWVIDHDRSVKINGDRYRSPLGFYRKLGFRVHQNDRIEKERISGVKIEWDAGKL